MKYLHKKQSGQLLLLMCAVLTGLFFASCKQESKQTEKADQPLCISDSMARLIRIDSATISNIDDELKLSGVISFNDNKVVKLFPFGSGVVQKVMASVGDYVKKGQALAIIRSADVAGSYSDLSTAGRDLDIAQRQYENTAALYKNGIASAREMAESEENFKKAKLNTEKIKNTIAINSGGHSSPDGTYIVTAPMNGYVVEKKISPGSYIRSDNSENLFTVGDISDVWVWANVYESDIARVKEGFEAKVTTLAYPDTEFIGVVDKVNQILDPESKVMKIRIRLPNANRMLKPDMFANIMIENKEAAKAVTIPSSAVISDNGHNYAIIYHDKCQLELRSLDIIKTLGKNSFVKKGIEPGEKLISQNQILYYNALKED